MGRWANEQMSIWDEADVDVEADADAVTPNSNTRSYARRSVPSSLGWSFFHPMATFLYTRQLPPGNAECSKTCLWSSPNFCQSFVQLLKLGLTSLSSRSNTGRIVFAPDGICLCTLFAKSVFGNLFMYTFCFLHCPAQVDHSAAVKSWTKIFASCSTFWATKIKSKWF